jgi:hypothetical protein
MEGSMNSWKIIGKTSGKPENLVKTNAISLNNIDSGLLPG